ncbi:tRNA1(Val) (adenine(37)-N6)-methyltransferase [Roseospirillum parvum]|uniref:tRNA1(Val) A37 N6-methylase TrmN6 n=1 Tax=Roseospirillum parvum TaxID=83401 RepID=A0A1G8AYK5_9PROT|nr:methyltransferase [Roseospirillum parvum]SDH26008.1 tRNA1(Val) A37 N6-methylase TrmN6 [Roseospirillum parvum]
MAEPAATTDAATDTLLGGRVRLDQGDGYRVSMDAVLLAAAVPASPGQAVLELGLGTGAASLCLAARVPGLDLTGLEINPEMRARCRRNLALNGAAVRVVAGDVAAPPPDEVPRDAYDQVLLNPPYGEPGRHRVPRDATRALAHVEGGGREGGASLAEWIACAHGRLKSGGWLSLIHRADRLDAVLAQLHGRFGAITVLPLWPMADRPARRVVVVARKGAATPTALLPGLTLHQPDGSPTEAARRVLADMAPLMAARPGLT